MSEVSIIGLDIAKHVFQAHGVDASGHAVLRQKISRAKLLLYFAAHPRARSASACKKAARQEERAKMIRCTGRRHWPNGSMPCDGPRMGRK